ncbi:2'-5' RNA ligase family protein [Flavobacterium sp. AS60]|uniref:2'-5' RNA ligase family protein n=1 Tax=Flavobacterium anseongense TaxID=2910677 RepID=UPI001F3C0FA8|nr:2'-5' RNA ligase family protein [Flavobacterium sp. AS60]MCF6129028.1 2'-5' RNA ligase family protein [Flavobacterium sp. AS60]
MKEIPLYSLVIFPTQEQIELVKSYKQLLKSHIPKGYGSANAKAHITIIQFKTHLEFMLYINQIREFCKSVKSQKVIFNSWGKFEYAGAFFISPDAVSKVYLDSLIVSINEYLGFKIDTKNVNAHMSIGRKLYGKDMKIAEELFGNIQVNLKFNCDTLQVRKFNNQTKQYSDIIEKISFGK